MVVVGSKSAFCPVCDREYTDRTKPLALRKMVRHLKRAHPDYYVAWIDDQPEDVAAWLEANP